jgi:glycosyltransferase involved in cell wall biosynthesis
MEKAQPVKISIVTPSYNCAAFIRETIESILVQGELSLEHIVIDGGSNDGTVDILKLYPHLTWVSEKDRGQSHALNKAFAMAQGDIIGWLNADDTYEPGTFEKVFRIFENNPDIDFIGTDIHIIDEQSRSIGFSKGKPFDLNEMLLVNTVKQPTVFMRKEMVKKLVGVDESLHYVMDYEFWVRAITEGFHFKYVPIEVFANFRMVSGTKSFENFPGFYLEWENTVQGFYKTPRFENLPNKVKIINKINGQYYIAQLIQAINGRNRKEAITNLIYALKADSSLWLNKGIYKFIYLSLFGKERSLVAKYQ